MAFMRKIIHVGKKNFLPGAACCIAALCVSVFSFTIDLSPVALGNTWVYRRAVPGIMWFPGHDYIRTITIVNVTKRGQDSLVFDVTYHDSGSDSTYRVDSIVKTSTSIGPAGALSLYFRISKIDTALISGHYFLRNDTVVYAAGGSSSNPFGASFDTSVYMDNVGLVYHFSQSNFRESYYQDGDALISFKPGTSSTRVSRGFKGISQALYSRSSPSPGFQRLLLVNNTSNNRLPLPAELFDVRGRLMKKARYGSASGVFYYYRADCGRGTR
jgi:hypothetical protein